MFLVLARNADKTNVTFDSMDCLEVGEVLKYLFWTGRKNLIEFSEASCF